MQHCLYPSGVWGHFLDFNAWSSYTDCRELNIKMCSIISAFCKTRLLFVLEHSVKRSFDPKLENLISDYWNSSKPQTDLLLSSEHLNEIADKSKMSTSGCNEAYAYEGMCIWGKRATWLFPRHLIGCWVTCSVIAGKMRKGRPYRFQRHSGHMLCKRYDERRCENAGYTWEV